MRSNVKMTFDGYGYINNRGLSKYWGVSKTHHTQAYDGYRILVNEDGRCYTLSLESINADEQEAAQIAYQLFGQRIADRGNRFKIQTHKSKNNYEVDIDYNLVYFDKDKQGV